MSDEWNRSAALARAFAASTSRWRGGAFVARGVEKLACHPEHLVDGSVEKRVGLPWRPSKASQFADGLQGRIVDRWNIRVRVELAPDHRPRRFRQTDIVGEAPSAGCED